MLSERHLLAAGLSSRDARLSARVRCACGVRTKDADGARFVRVRAGGVLVDNGAVGKLEVSYYCAHVCRQAREQHGPPATPYIQPDPSLQVTRGGGREAKARWLRNRSVQ
jgi:hypothetical protein